MRARVMGIPVLPTPAAMSISVWRTAYCGRHTCYQSSELRVPPARPTPRADHRRVGCPNLIVYQRMLAQSIKEHHRPLQRGHSSYRAPSWQIRRSSSCICPIGKTSTGINRSLKQSIDIRPVTERTDKFVHLGATASRPPRGPVHDFRYPPRTSRRRRMATRP